MDLKCSRTCSSAAPPATEKGTAVPSDRILGTNVLPSASLFDDPQTIIGSASLPECQLLALAFPIWSSVTISGEIMLPDKPPCVTGHSFFPMETVPTPPDNKVATEDSAAGLNWSPCELAKGIVFGIGSRVHIDLRNHKNYMLSCSHATVLTASRHMLSHDHSGNAAGEKACYATLPHLVL
ncbi:uncharacterized protein RBU57_011648 isoform 1-T1 [Macrochelys suwanniensis]